MSCYTNLERIAFGNKLLDEFREEFDEKEAEKAIEKIIRLYEKKGELGSAVVGNRIVAKEPPLEEAYQKVKKELSKRKI